MQSRTQPTAQAPRAVASAKVPEPPLSKQEIFQGIRRFVSFLLIAALVISVISHSGSFNANLFQYHPIMMSTAMVVALPEVMGSVAQMKRGRRGLPRKEVILHHQMATLVFNVCAMLGLAAVEYTKYANGYPHLVSLHGFVGSAFGAALLSEMVLGNMLRYVLPHQGNLRHICKTAHGLLSMTICVTGLLCLMGGLLSTQAAKEMIGSSALRGFIGFGAPLCVMWGYMR